MPKMIDPETVLAIRERHSELREWAADPDTAEGLETAHDLDVKVAQEFDLGVSTIRNLVLGMTRLEIGGPVDHARRIRAELYAAERTTYGPAEARRRRAMRQNNVDPDTLALPTMLVVEIRDAMGSTVATERYPADHSVSTWVS